MRSVDCIEQCPLSGVTQKTFANEFFLARPIAEIPRDHKTGDGVWVNRTKDGLLLTVSTSRPAAAANEPAIESSSSREITSPIRSKPCGARSMNNLVVQSGRFQVGDNLDFIGEMIAKFGRYRQLHLVLDILKVAIPGKT
jgi:hypothetical protein